MKQITEDYCSFEVAKLLKEKRFINDFCRKYYNYGPENWHSPLLDEISNFPCNHNFYDGKCSAPTHQMALKWLREVHDLHIIVYPWQADNEEKAIHWCCTVYKAFAHLGNDVYTNETPKSYEEAVEAALLYVLKNLI